MSSTFDMFDDVPSEKVEQTTTTTGINYPKITRPKLSFTNEELVSFIQNGLEPEKYKTELVHYNTALIYKIAKSLYSPIPLDDKIQYGFLGLMEAVYSYTPNTGTLFSTYASTCIQQHIRRYSNQDAKLIDYPEKHASDAHKIKQFKNAYAVTNDGKEPTPEEISKELKMSLSDIKRASENYNFLNFDAPAARDVEYTLSDIIPDSNYDLGIEILYDDFDSNVHLILKELHENDRELLCRVHGLNGYEVETIDQIFKSGFSDKNGKPFKTAISLYRYYHITAQSLSRHIKKLGLDIKKPI